MEEMPFSSAQSSAPGGFWDPSGPAQDRAASAPELATLILVFVTSGISLIPTPSLCLLFLLLCLYISGARSYLCCQWPRLCCQLGFFGCKQQKLAPAKRTVNGDGKAGEPGSERTAAEGVLRILVAGSSEPTTGRHQPPPSPTHVALGIPRRKQAGLSDQQPHQDCTQRERGSES